MASGQTTNYNLNHWEAGDKVLREEFNADNATIDGILAELANGKADNSRVASVEQTMVSKAEQSTVTALDGRALRFATGSYTGTGTYGSTAPCQLDFTQTLGRAPIFFMVRQESDSDTTKSPVLAGVRGVKGCSVYPSLINTSGSICSLTWSGTTVSWYGKAAQEQMNKSGSQYYYFAVG